MAAQGSRNTITQSCALATIGRRIKTPNVGARDHIAISTPASVVRVIPNTTSSPSTPPNTTKEYPPEHSFAAVVERVAITCRDSSTTKLLLKGFGFSDQTKRYIFTTTRSPVTPGSSRLPRLADTTLPFGSIEWSINSDINCSWADVGTSENATAVKSDEDKAPAKITLHINPTIEELLNDDHHRLASLPKTPAMLRLYYTSGIYSSRNNEQLAPYRSKIVIDTQERLLDFLEIASKATGAIAELFLDLEGNQHGKDGVLCVIQFTFASIIGTTFLLLVKVMGQALFDTVGSGTSVKRILEDPSIIKVLFDCREDSAALYHQYGVALEGIIDLQIMELAGRTSNNKHLWSLDTCIDKYLKLKGEEETAWRSIKHAGKECFAGDFSKWELNPLPEILLNYAANDTVFMPHLYAYFLRHLHDNPAKMHIVMVESARRVKDSQDASLVSSGALAPAAFRPNRGYRWR